MNFGRQTGDKTVRRGPQLPVAEESVGARMELATPARRAAIRKTPRIATEEPTLSGSSRSVDYL